MEETGILENSTLHGLVLPHFEPGPYYKARAYDKAVTLFSKAIELSATDDQAYSLRAACRTALGDKASADSDRRAAADLKRLQQQLVATQYAPPNPRELQ